MEQGVLASKDIKIGAPIGRRLSRRFRYRLLLVLLDQAALLIGIGLAQGLRDVRWLSPGGVDIAVLASPIYFMMALMRDAYGQPVLANRALSINRAAFAWMAMVATLLLIVLFFSGNTKISRVGLTVALACSGLLIIVSRRLFTSIVKSRPRYELVSELLIIDSPDDAMPPFGDIDVLNTWEEGLSADVDNPYALHQLGRIMGYYDRVIVSCSRERRGDWALVLKGANVQGEIVQPGLRALGAFGIGSAGDEDTVMVARGPLSIVQRAEKRLLDLAITIPVLILLLPVMIATAIAIRLDSPGPVFFRQVRIGRGNRLFRIYKFRSMRHESSDGQGARSTARDDDRITRVGRFIRRTSIDELPQLINVLLGDMSLVGPRPHALGSLAGDELFWKVNREYWVRHALKPGITGLAQVRGFRGATHERVDLLNRLEADLEYLSGWTLPRDLAIMLSTVRVLFHRNAY